jgi:ABC-type enterobactin transport system permease subunit
LTDRDLTSPDEDELLRPALAGVEHELPVPGRRPWRLSSQLYVGFFGGALATTVIAWLNATRLGLPQRDRLLIAGVGVLGLVAAAVAVLVIDPGSVQPIRLVLGVSGIATAALQSPLQKNADRRYGFRHGEGSYDSLWVPGLVAVLVLGTAQNAALYLLVQA